MRDPPNGWFKRDNSIWGSKGTTVPPLMDFAPRFFCIPCYFWSPWSRHSLATRLPSCISREIPSVGCDPNSQHRDEIPHGEITTKPWGALKKKSIPRLLGGPRDRFWMILLPEILIFRCSPDAWWWKITTFLPETRSSYGRFTAKAFTLSNSIACATARRAVWRPWSNRFQYENATWMIWESPPPS